MVVSLSRFNFFFVASLLLTASFTITAVANEPHALRRLTAEQSIAAEIQIAHKIGDLQPRFTLQAQLIESSNIFTIAEVDFEVNVRVAVPAITSKTTLSIQNGTISYVNSNDVATMLVSNEDDVIALIAVEKKGGQVDGIVQKKNGKKMKFRQNSDGGKVRFEQKD